MIWAGFGSTIKIVSIKIEGRVKMLSLIFRFTGKYKKETIITPILTVIECIFDVLIPYVMSK